MNYQQPDLLEQLAAAYVLGTLHGRPRTRFERLSAQSEAVRAAVYRWEDRLMPLLPSLTPMTPSKKVWARIARRIQVQEAPARRRLAPWQWAGAALLALSLLIGVSIRLLNPSQQLIAAVGQDVAHPLWQVSRSKDSSALTLRALISIQAHPQSAYELWALLPNGKPPVSLGLLPRSGHIERSLTLVQRGALLSATKVAVSLEPAGGSPTGSPTGPVLYVADVSITG